MKKITVIGGGTGTFVVLSGLKKHRLDLGVIVSMMDSGGSTGRLRDQLEVLPPGDLRQSLLALSDAPQLWRKLFLYRFQNGDLNGHNFGNLFLSALEKVSSNYEEVVKTASFVLKIKGKVLPVTFDKTNLCVEYENGKIVKGEGNIDTNYTEESRIKRAYLTPLAKPNPSVIKRIMDSDYIITGPGDLYTSIIPIVLVEGVKDAMLKTKAKFIYIMNLMTKLGQTTRYSARDHIEDIVRYFGRAPEIIIINNGPIQKDIVTWYQSQNEHLVKNDLKEYTYNSELVEKDVVDRKKFVKEQSDELTRSILRHSSRKLANVILKIIT